MRDMDPPVSNAFRDSGSISFGSSRANRRVSQASAAARVSPAPWQARRELIEIHPAELLRSSDIGNGCRRASCTEDLGQAGVRVGASTLRFTSVLL